MKVKLLFHFVLPLILLHLSFHAFAQEAARVFTAKLITDPIKIDGVLDEAVWQTAGRSGEFWQFFPSDSVRAQYPTEFSILYNETTLYVGVKAGAANGNYVVSTLQRDFDATANDNISLLFDTFNDGANAFFFGVTPYGVQREGLVSGGGATFNNNWDIKWQAQSQRYDDHYVVEIAIPFTSLKFQEGGTRWRFRPYRWNHQSNEQTTWVQVPQNQLLSNLAFMGELVFERPLGKSRTPIALIPYVNTLAQRNYETDKGDTNLKFGGDAKVAVGDGMNLDITVNPDFSNTEVDDIFTNLTRFELFLPEKRQFFIDNSDLFGSFGNSLDNIPFFSRRVGLARDTLGNLIENQILAGARLSGKLDENWRLGLLNIQTAGDAGNEIPSNNNTMIALQRKVFSRSNIGAFLVNRQAIGDYDFLDENNRYNRVLGLDYNLASKDNTWTGRFWAHKSFQPGDNKGNLAAQAMLIRLTRDWRFVADFVHVDDEYRSDLGFVPRRGIFKTGQSATRYFYPQSGPVSRHSLLLLFINFWRPSLDFKHTDGDYRLTWDASFRNQATLRTSLNHNFIYLTNPFDPTRSGGTPLPAQKNYYFQRISSEYVSSPARLLTFTGTASVGEFFNGKSLAFSSNLAYRLQPWAQLSVALNYDHIRLPEPHADADLWLVSPRLNITFSKSLFWSTLFQYSNQRNNFGVNSRLQWRFAPLSDLFLVYNDNYFSDDFSPRFRSVNLKVTYWLGI